MIRFFDAYIIAQTKLRTHRIRTGFAIATASLLFGLIAAVVLITQGAFDSIDRFSSEGLNSRTIATVTKTHQEQLFNEYESRYDETFIKEVEVAHQALVARKTAAAKKYGVYYDPLTSDPSPISKDPATKQRYIDDSGLSSKVVEEIATSKRKAATTPFDINAYLAPYNSAHVIQKYQAVTVEEGSLAFMKNGREVIDQKTQQYTYQYDSDAPSLVLTDGSLTTPFLTSTNFDLQSGEIPAVVPYSAAVKALGYEPLPGTASTEEQLARLAEVRSRISEVKVSFCYRNQASLALVNEAVAQRDEMKRNVGNADYIAPKVQYAVPDETSCGPVLVTKDSRSAQDKKDDANRVLYEKEVDEYVGDPMQQKIDIRGVGVTGDPATGASGWSVSEFIRGLLGSSLGYGAWSIPADIFAQLPSSARPDAVFASRDAGASSWGYGAEEYLVEFSDRDQARKLMNDTGMFGGNMIGDVIVSPFGSAALLVDEAQKYVADALRWVLIVVGAIAAVILGAVIGRTVSEGRRESAVFRAIGARRGDIVAIYGSYVSLLAFWVIVASGVMAAVAAYIIEMLYWKDATVGARLSYAASTSSTEFHLFSVNSAYLLYIVAAIIGAAFLASIIPIILGARRNPIKDMRDDA